MTRWSHGHSVAAGVAGGLILDRHVLLVFALGALLGGIGVLSTRFLRAAGHTVRARAGELHAATLERMRAETERKQAAAAEAREKAAHRIRRAAEQAAAEKKAYIQGAIDGTP
jgi:ribosomal protein S13